MISFRVQNSGHFAGEHVADHQHRRRSAEEDEDEDGEEDEYDPLGFGIEERIQRARPIDDDDSDNKVG